jgi:hypothetical protein
MNTYYYPQVTGGYRWNMLQRIYNTIGLEPTGSGDVQQDGVWKTYLTFSRALTTQEKASVDAIMADNPTFPPTTTNTVYTLKDIWETRQEFSTKLGNLQFRIYYSESVPGSGLLDRIELHFLKNLSAAERNKVADEHSKLLVLKQA